MYVVHLLHNSFSGVLEVNEYRLIGLPVLSAAER